MDNHKKKFLALASDITKKIIFYLKKITAHLKISKRLKFIQPIKINQEPLELDWVSFQKEIKKTLDNVEFLHDTVSSNFSFNEFSRSEFMTGLDKDKALPSTLELRVSEKIVEGSVTDREWKYRENEQAHKHLMDKLNSFQRFFVIGTLLFIVAYIVAYKIPANNSANLYYTGGLIVGLVSSISSIIVAIWSRQKDKNSEKELK